MSTMNKGNMSRRGFLAQSLAGLTVAGLPMWFAKETLATAEEKKEKKAAPNDRIAMGAIGTGTNRLRRGNGQLHGERGVHTMNDARGQPGVQMIAVCDVD